MYNRTIGSGSECLWSTGPLFFKNSKGGIYLKINKDITEQIDLLKSRGLLFSEDKLGIDDARHIIEQENYYNIINGYSSLFLKKDERNQRIKPQIYLNGVEFQEVYSLYRMDRELRGVLSKTLDIFETNIKSILSRIFTKKYGVNYSYLNLSNYKNNPEDVSISLRQIALLSNMISNKNDVKFDNSIKHYISKHNDVPLWVLVNYLTIGNISHLFSALKIQDQNEISKWYSEKFNFSKQDSWKDIRITPQYLSSALKSANLLRNVCAHGERLYCFRISSFKKSSIFNFFQQQNGIDYSIISSGSLFEQIIYLRAFLTLDQTKDFYQELMMIIKRGLSDLNSVRQEIVLFEMGFIEDWENYLNKLIN